MEFSSTTIWQWTPEPSPGLRTRIRLATVAIVAIVAASIVAAVVSPARASIVLAALVASASIFCWWEHRRFRATVVELERDGTLRVGNGRTTSTIDLSAVDSIEIRRRKRTGSGLGAYIERWTIDIAGPEQVLSHGIDLAAGFFNLDESQLRELQEQLRTEARRLGAPLPTNDVTERFDGV